ncbi:MAG: hypothetical protein MZV49_26970 [Rhodopseudomonas palustris]|nr:hypothetical protein [Rhodopseudomonas palustris]
MRNPGGLEYDEFTGCNAFAEFADIVFDRFRQSALNEPYANKARPSSNTVTAFNPTASKAAANKCDVKAGPKLILDQFAWPTHFLPALLKTGRRLSIVKSESRNRRIDGSR